MNDEGRLEIPRRIDDKPKFLWWDMDQAMIVMSFLMGGIMLNAVGSGLVLGIFVGVAFSKARSGKHQAFALHLMYWYLPSYAMKFKTLPPSHQTEYIG
jgi:conjugal transfer pilus assembly protein TraL